MKKTNKSTLNQLGFTLIELSIVLVIIGLIVGGVLVGQDLIRAAEIRATVSQLEKYNAAVNTFRNKFGYIPGDIPASIASQFGMNLGSTYMTGLGVGLGDGNGLVESGGGSAQDLTNMVGEQIFFWEHLTEANLVDGCFGGKCAATPITTGGVPTAAVTAATLNQWVPAAKLGRGNGVFTYYASGYNMYQIIGASGISVAGVYTLTNNMTPIEARNIDTKVDDGLPYSGVAQATDATTATALNNTAASAATGKCVNGVIPAGYTVTTADGNTPLCGLKVRFN